MSAFFCAARSARMSSAGRFCASRVLLSRTRSSRREAYILTKEEGGRHTPFFNNYRPQFYFRTTDVTGIVQLPEGTEMVMPGDNVAMEVELIVPIAMGRRSCASPSVKAVAPSAPVSSPPSWIDQTTFFEARPSPQAALYSC